MPLYEYRCEKCGKLVEKIQKFSDRPLKTCSKCGGKLERLVSASALQFKGSGWYITDYARKPAASEGSSEKTETPAKPDGSGGKGDTNAVDKKPAEKKPAKTKSSK